MTNTINVRHVI